MNGHMFIALQVRLAASFTISSERVAHKHDEAALTDCVFALESVILSMVQFSTMRSETVLGYIWQDKDLAVLSHAFPGLDVLSDLV